MSDPTLQRFMQNYWNTIMTYYTAYLVMGHTLHLSSTRLDAIVKYLKTVVVFFHSPRNPKSNSRPIR